MSIDVVYPDRDGKTYAEQVALDALHGWLHDPLGDGELIEAAAEFHAELADRDGGAECKALDSCVEPGAAVRRASVALVKPAELKAAFAAVYDAARCAIVVETLRPVLDRYVALYEVCRR